MNIPSCFTEYTFMLFFNGSRDRPVVALLTSINILQVSVATCTIYGLGLLLALDHSQINYHDCYRLIIIISKNWITDIGFLAF